MASKRETDVQVVLLLLVVDVVPSFLFPEAFFFFCVSIFFLAFGVRRGFPNAGFDEMFLQEFKTKEEVKAFFVRWAAEKKDKDGFRDLDA